MRCYGDFYKEAQQPKSKDFLTRLDNAVYRPDASHRELAKHKLFYSRPNIGGISQSAYSHQRRNMQSQEIGTEIPSQHLGIQYKVISPLDRIKKAVGTAQHPTRPRRG